MLAEMLGFWLMVPMAYKNCELQLHVRLSAIYQEYYKLSSVMWCLSESIRRQHAFYKLWALVLHMSLCILQKR